MTTFYLHKGYVVCPHGVKIMKESQLLDSKTKQSFEAKLGQVDLESEE